MFSRAPIRSTVGVVLLLAALTTGLFVSPGIRHRHDDGDAAHSHSHHHDHGHHHSHGHSHSHTHSHAHAEHHPEDEGGGSELGESSQIEAKSSTHVHISVFGFELTLPDFFDDDRAAPIVVADSEQRLDASSERSETPQDDEVLRLPSPLSLGHLVPMILSWTAIVCCRFQPHDANILVGMPYAPADLNWGRHPPAPPLPPPKAR